MKFRRKPQVIEALTFGELVAHGARECEKAGHALGPNAMPWSFNYAGHPVTQENDDCYLISTLTDTVRMGRGDMLITSADGEIYACPMGTFQATFELGD